MEFNLDNVYKKMLGEAESAFGDGWNSIKAYAPGEFKKLAGKMVDIAKNVAAYDPDDNAQGYPPEVGKNMLEMAVNAMNSVLLAVATLTLIAIEKAVNAILDVLKSTFTELAGIVI